MVISQSSGNEPWVFRVDRPDELIGAHRELIASAIPQSEPIRYLLYSPRWEGRGRHFGIEASPASHALAVTGRRFVISRDAHDGAAPTVTSMPFECIVSVEKGSALLLAWLVIRYAADARLDTFTILHKSTGSHHIDESLRVWRATLRDLVARAVQHDEHWKSVPRFLYHEIEPLLLAGEAIRASLHASERWHETRRFFIRRASFLQPWTSLILADHSVIFGVAEQPEQRLMHAFGANVVIVPADAVADASAGTLERNGGSVNRLHLALSRAGASMSYDVAFDGPSAMGESVARMVGLR